MKYELILTAVLILLGFLAYRQYARSRRIYLFQEAVDLRLSACYAEEEVCLKTNYNMVKLRIELIHLSDQYRCFYVEKIGFMEHEGVFFQDFKPTSFSLTLNNESKQEFVVLIAPEQVSEIRLNGLELCAHGYLLCQEEEKHSVYQKFIVFERPAFLDLSGEKNRA